ncbi:hypothetical protein BT69DRAFT_1327315 [Atractiella rhizophila]|nr:hypothetical protein BT69DRAFT_1327315 [Atractiella rhizophila]
MPKYQGRRPKRIEKNASTRVQDSFSVSEIVCVNIGGCTQEYQQGLHIIGHPETLALGLKVSLERYPWHGHLNITRLFVNVIFDVTNGKHPPAIKSMFPNNPPKWIKKRHKSNPRDETIAYPKDFKEQFGDQSKTWITESGTSLLGKGIGTNKATWVLKFKRKKPLADAGFAVVVMGPQVDRNINIEVVAMSRRFLLFSNRYEVPESDKLESGEKWPIGWSNPRERASWLATQNDVDPGPQG